MADNALAPAETRVKTAALPRGNLKLREYANQTFRAIAPRGTTRERLTDSDYWSIVADLFTAFDEIIVISESRDFYARLVVLSAGRGYCQLELLEYHALAPLVVTQEGLPPNHEIIHLGCDDLYAVRRCSDGIILGKGFPSREEALAFLVEHATLR